MCFDCIFFAFSLQIYISYNRH